MVRQKGTSIAKIEANRRNALRSTGPKTPEGKNTVKWNALKHGLLAKEVVIPAGDGQENAAELKSLLAQLREDLQPQGVLEEILVEDIATCYWRLKRALRCETGEIRKELDTVGWREVMKREDDFSSAKMLLPLDERRRRLRANPKGTEVMKREDDFSPADMWLLQDERRRRLRANPKGLQYLIRVLEGIREKVQEVGHLSEEAQRRLDYNFGLERYGVTDRCAIITQIAAIEARASKQGPEHLSYTASTETSKKIIEQIDVEISDLEDLMAITENMEDFELEAKMASLHLPSREAIDKNLRYEATIKRDLYRAMNQLERFQRQRKGSPPTHKC